MYTSNQQALLRLFISNPEQEYHLHEIGRILQKKPGIFQKALNALEKEGLLKSRRRGNQRIISLNRQYPLLKEITLIIRKTVGIEAMLEGIVEHDEGIKCAFIFGSYARNKMRTDSDVDVIVVGKRESEDRFLAKLAKVERQIQREINPRFYTTGEYNRKKKADDPFLTEILSERHLVLKGNP